MPKNDHTMWPCTSTILLYKKQSSNIFLSFQTWLEVAPKSSRSLESSPSLVSYPLQHFEIPHFYPNRFSSGPTVSFHSKNGMTYSLFIMACSLWTSLSWTLFLPSFLLVNLGKCCLAVRNQLRMHSSWKPSQTHQDGLTHFTIIEFSKGDWFCF